MPKEIPIEEVKKDLIAQGLPACALREVPGRSRHCSMHTQQRHRRAARLCPFRAASSAVTQNLSYAKATAGPGKNPPTNSQPSTSPSEEIKALMSVISIIDIGEIVLLANKFKAAANPVEKVLISQDIHIALLGETKLQPRQEHRLPNFCVYRRDEFSSRGIAYRGTAILVRRDIVHEGLEQPDFTAIRTIEVRVGVAGAELLYRLRFESHLPDRPTTTTDSEEHGYEVVEPDTTHIPTDSHFGADILDVVLFYQLPYPIHVEMLYDTDTLHLPLLITLGTTAHTTSARPLTHRNDWSAYKRALEELHIGKSLSCPEDI
ncbi:hypothetical protein EVAR_35678_1 [Eumeta japonica]|uniref:Uncharacterized protein n=1 Tax=Eumeta variegata TaxID=151549 RepID=A0A4C1VHM0_EUMVA|nr:hypothetical protein EVAR_35678_1 [Eumeta japonica]